MVPQGVDIAQQLEVSAGHVEALQRRQGSLEARDGVVARLGRSHDQQAAVNVVLVAAEGGDGGLLLGVVLALAVLCIVEVALGVVELLLEQAVLRRDARQQLIEGVEVAGRLQLVVEEVVHARVVVVGAVHAVDASRWCEG